MSLQPDNEPQHNKGLLYSAAGALFFTFDVPLLRLADADALTLATIRGILLFLGLTAIWFISGRRHAYIGGLAGLAVIATNTLSNLLFMGAVVHTAAANLVLILALNPLFCALFARIFLGEPIHRRTIVALALCGIGVATIAWDSLKSGQFLGDLMALGVAICTAAALTIVRKSRANLVNSFAVGGLISAAIALPFALPMTVGAHTFYWLALSGLIVMPAAMILVAMGPRYIPAAEVAMFYLLETFITPVWIWLIFNEVPSQHVLLGGAIILLTLIAHSIFRLRLSSLSQRLEPASGRL